MPGVPRVHGGRVSGGCAHCRVRDECIYGVYVRPGQGRDGARTVPGPVPELCNNSARQCHNTTPDTRYPTPDIRNPPPLKYPGY